MITMIHLSNRSSYKLLTKKESIKYTGDQLAGIGTLHKSNMVPVRKDSNIELTFRARLDY